MIIKLNFISNKIELYLLLKKRFLLIILTIIFPHYVLFAQQKDMPSKNIDIVMDIDNNEYNVRNIGTQLWMGKNLKVTHFNNGDSIENVKDSKKWINYNTGAWAHYDNNRIYDNSYGKLYNWYVINDSRGVCPTGWRIPKVSDWEILLKYLETNLDPVGLSIIGGGCRSGENGDFLYSGDDSYFWIYDNNSIVYGWNRDMLPNGAGMYRQGVLKTDGYSIRCIKNN